MNNRMWLGMIIFAGLGFVFSAPAKSQEWKAGVAVRVITPKQPMWTSGYGGRKAPASETLDDLHVKALTVVDSQGSRVVIVTSDLIGLNYEFTEDVAREAQKRYNISRDNLLLTASHTHSGPEMRPFVEKTPGYHYTKIDAETVPREFAALIPPYVEWLKGEFIEVIGESLAATAPASLEFSSFQPVPFAVSRRHPDGKGGILYRSTPSSYFTGGPRDDTVPVLNITDSGGNIRVILFGYACHPITLNENVYSADYPGYAQRYIEEAYPGATALFVQGCAGQLVPNARNHIEYAQGHGRSLAVAVKDALDGGLTPVPGPVRCAYEDVAVAFQSLPPRAELEEIAASGPKTGPSSRKRHAALILARMDKGETIPSTMPCPVQALRFGDDILLVGLCGEPVAEYALKIKESYLTHKFVWVAGYCTHEFGYLPTWNVWREGGYEAGDALYNTPYPGPLAGDVEKRVLDGVGRVVGSVMGH